MKRVLMMLILAVGLNANDYGGYLDWGNQFG